MRTSNGVGRKEVILLAPEGILRTEAGWLDLGDRHEIDLGLRPNPPLDLNALGSLLGRGCPEPSVLSGLPPTLNGLCRALHSPPDRLKQADPRQSHEKPKAHEKANQCEQGEPGATDQPLQAAAKKAAKRATGQMREEALWNAQSLGLEGCARRQQENEAPEPWATDQGRPGGGALRARGICQ